MLKKWLPLFITLALAILLAGFALTPPSPKNLQTPQDAFSSARAMKDVRIIAAKPHPTGSDENRKVRDYLMTRLEELGAEVQTETSLIDTRALKRLNRWGGTNKTEQEFVNVIGVLPGTDRKAPALLLMAHHDTVWESPGAADDTIGIAAMLEIMRAVKAEPRKRDLILLFTDAEEIGLVGARYFFDNNPLNHNIGVVINFEARGGGGTANLFQTSRQNGEAVRLFAKHVKEPSASSLSTFVYNVLPNDTDLTPALKKDYTAYNIANIGRAEYYHSPDINSDVLDESTLQHMGAQGLDLTRALLTADALPGKKADATFFDLFGFFTIIYPAFFGWIFLAIAALFYIMSIDRKAPKKAILYGSLKMLSFIIVGAVLLYGLNRVSGSGPGSNYYDRLAAILKLEATALFTCLAVFFAFFGRTPLSANARLGAALPLFVIAAAGQYSAPTATYFITLPVLLCALIFWISKMWPTHKLGLALSILVAAIISGYMIGLGHLLMQGVGPDMLSVAILPASLTALALLPLYVGLPKTINRYLIISGLILAIAIALWIRLDPIAVTVPSYS